MFEGAGRIEGRPVALGLYRTFGERVIGFFPHLECFLMTIPAARRASVLREGGQFVFQEWLRGSREVGRSFFSLPSRLVPPPGREEYDDHGTRQRQPPHPTPAWRGL